MRAILRQQPTYTREFVSLLFRCDLDRFYNVDDLLPGGMVIPEGLTRKNFRTPFSKGSIASQEVIAPQRRRGGLVLLEAGRIEGASWGFKTYILVNEKRTRTHVGWFRRGGRVAEGAGLENRYALSGHRGFKSHPLRETTSTRGTSSRRRQTEKKGFALRRDQEGQSGRRES